MECGLRFGDEIGVGQVVRGESIAIVGLDDVTKRKIKRFGEEGGLMHGGELIGGEWDAEA